MTIFLGQLFYTQTIIVLKTFVNVSRPGDSKETFESSCHLLLHV